MSLLEDAEHPLGRSPKSSLVLIRASSAIRRVRASTSFTRSWDGLEWDGGLQGRVAISVSRSAIRVWPSTWSRSRCHSAAVRANGAASPSPRHSPETPSVQET